MCIGLYIKYPVFLSDLNETWIFSTDFLRILKISYCTKIRQVGAELFHAHVRHDEANSHFSQFCDRAWKVMKQAPDPSRKWLLA